jgi:PAS domain S-box-containing protein
MTGIGTEAGTVMAQSTAKILVVEDEKIVALSIVSILKASGYEIPAIVGNGQAAIQAAARTVPDLALIDILLTGEMDGIETGKELRQRLDIPVIYLTACSDEKTLQRAKITEPFGYLVKPFAEHELSATVEMALHRHRLEKAVKIRERWFTATMNCIGEAIITTDVNGQTTFLNPRAAELTGWKPEEGLGAPLKQLVPLIDEHSQKPLEFSIFKSGAHGHQTCPEEKGEALLVTRRGDHHLISYHLSTIRDEREQDAGMVLAFHDIAQRRALEKQFLATQKMEAIGKMASSVTHEFSNLMSVIAGYASSVLEHLIPHTRAYDDTLKIMEATRHAGMLTKRILGIARVTPSEAEIKIEPVSLADAVRNAATLVEKSLADRRIALQIKDLSRAPAIMADPHLFGDVLIDLFMSAADTMPDGGAIHLEAARKSVRKPDPKLNAYAKAGRYGVLLIRDTSKGLPPEALEHIFEPFFASKEGSLPVGLGLSMAQNAVQRLGGWIKATSKINRGTTLSVYVPAAPLAQPRAARRALRKGPPRILVVDDHAEVLREAQHVLEDAGYRVATAGGGDEAIALIRNRVQPFDLFIVDMIMPGKDGKEVLAAILEADAGASVVITSGFSRDYVRSLLPPGAWKFMQKPFDRHQLLSAAKRALEPPAS